MADDRLERLTNLVAFLLHSDRPVTQAEIVESVPGYPPGTDARRQAFERDKRLLRDERIPLVEEGGRYRIRAEDYFLPDLGLDDAERLALQVAVAAVSVSPGEAAAGLRKLGGTAVSTGGGLGPTGLRADLVAPPVLPTLHAAARDRAEIRLTYGDHQRVVEPWGLLFRGGHWYLVAHDRLRAARRTFRVDRIQGDVVIGDPGSFDRPAGFDVAAAVPREPWLMGGDEAITAVVVVDAALAGRVEAELGPAARSERRPDGSAVVRLPVVNRQVFLSWVLGWLDHATVLGPPELRAEVVAWLQAMAGGSR